MTARSSIGGLRSLWVALVAYALASASLGIVGVVTAVVLYERSGSAGWATVGAAVRVAPFVVLSAFAGALASRWPARSSLLAASCAVALAAAAMVTVVEGGPLLAVAAVGFAAHGAWTVGYPSMASMVPRLVPRHALTSANGVMSTVESLAWIAGPGLGGAAIAAFGARSAAALGIVLAVTAVGVWVFVPAVAPAARTGGTSLLAVVRDGITQLRSPRLRGVIALQLAANLVYGALSVLLVIAAVERLGFGDGGYGALTAAMAAGSFVALLVVRRLGRTRRPLVPLALSVLASGLPVAVLALAETPLAAIVLVAVNGLGSVLVEVLALTILQRELPTSALAPVLGLLDAVAIGVIAIGTVSAGPLVAVLGLERSLVVVGAVVPALAVLVLPAVRFRWTEPVSLLGAAQLGVAVPMLAAARPAGSAGAVRVDPLDGTGTVDVEDDVEADVEDEVVGDALADEAVGPDIVGLVAADGLEPALDPVSPDPAAPSPSAPTVGSGAAVRSAAAVPPTVDASSGTGPGLVDPFDEEPVGPSAEPAGRSMGAVNDEDDLDDIVGGLPAVAETTVARSADVDAPPVGSDPLLDATWSSDPPADDVPGPLAAAPNGAIDLTYDPDHPLGGSGGGPPASHGDDLDDEPGDEIGDD